MKADIILAGFVAELHPERFLWIPGLRLLCVSDLHLEKGTFFSQFATLLPPYDSQETLEQLAAIIQLCQPATFIALGDSFHDKHAGKRLNDTLKNKLNGLINSIPQWIWITGNHDPEIDASIGGMRMDEVALHGIRFRHVLQANDTGFEISGHFHPKVSVMIKGHKMTGRCFVQSGKRLIMPSFGSYTGGLSISSRNFAANLPKPVERAFFTYQNAVHALPLSFII